jgi:phosphate ABC transporter phosphate-binding protein
MTLKSRPAQRMAAALVAVAATTTTMFASAPATAAPPKYVPISGDGSSWAGNAIDAWRGNVQQYGIVVRWTADGSSIGRNLFAQGQVNWAASDIPYGVKDGIYEDAPPTARTFAYMPDTAGGTVFMYNLKIGTRRVTNLRLSGENIAKIFTGVISKWNDPAIAADNPGLTLPAITVVPVVRSDGSGSTAQFTQWMVAQERSRWTAYCARVHRSPCTQTSAYPVLPGSGMVGQKGDLGVAGYVAQAQNVGTIGYVEYSYAKQAGFPVAKMLNAAGYYTEPTPGHVAVALLNAKINTTNHDPRVYLTQDLSKVYTNTDRRTYPLSSYSYMILPTDDNFGFDSDHGYTLGDFGKYLLCQGQSQVDALGYSALPINLVKAGFAQLRHIPGAKIPDLDTAAIKDCHNPTFSTNGTNTLAVNDPYPPACDKKGPTQCATGTGGASGQITPINPSAQGGGGSSNGGSAGGSNGSSGTSGSGGSASSSNSGGHTSAANSSAAGGGSSAPQPPCDPDSGTCGTPNSQGLGQNPVANPVSAATSLGDGLRVTLMIFAAVLLLGLGLAPPLIAQVSARRREQRDGAP